MISKILIANRGEIACRIIRTCKRLGIKTVAVYSSADANALHCTMADQSYLIGEAETKKSYLNISKILEVAKKAKVDAVHPGYGFLAENAQFAEALKKAGIVFIGPEPKAMRLVGDKIKAKELAKKLAVPLVPSIICSFKAGKEKAAVEEVKNFAKKYRYPLLIKAAAGGGGRGMRKVAKDKELSEALIAASREAQAFFGDGRVFVEKLVEHARHIEVQIFGDTRGNVIHLFNRDCTFQRYHQKVIEEATAPLLSEKTRDKIYNAATRLAEAAKYSNAGTVEFLVDQEENFYFLEVNSRLQVEHPVTEAVTNLDLVELQIRIAEGKSLKKLLKETPQQLPQGAAIECRLCAESPEHNFIATGGKLEVFEFPDSRTYPTVRVDSGYQQGDFVSHHYDSLLAKIIAHGPDRASALQSLISYLEQISIAGVQTNLTFLLHLLRAPEFARVEHHTRLAEQLVLRSEKLDDTFFITAGLALIAQLRPTSITNSDPWRQNSAWSLGGTRYLIKNFSISEKNVCVAVKSSGINKFTIHRCESRSNQIEDEAPLTTISIAAWNTNGFFFTQGTAPKQECRVFNLSSGLWVCTYNGIFLFEETLSKLTRRGEKEQTHSEQIASPLPGKIIDVRIAEGAKVKAGDTLLIIESMKMEHLLKAPMAAEVKKIHVKNGDTVEARALLAQLQYF